ncbi:hypothetical protein [Alienimonas californiensis]|uniref:Uncharacterized protein n=1 Tax=Alienimonas californiensis TaxID=2527989 RepID=A0A517P9G7_9PLAN|nr:hypothetical protein [Alienimonas californiensis]QDT16020.1 hypothetical protein CA12_21180 [Alienimonas californiensis]
MSSPEPSHAPPVRRESWPRFVGGTLGGVVPAGIALQGVLGGWLPLNSFVFGLLCVGFFASGMGVWLGPLAAPLVDRLPFIP